MISIERPAGENGDWLGPARSGTLAVDGDTVTVAETLFTVCPGDAPRQGRVEQMLRTNRAAPRRLGLVYHAPPECALSWTGKRHYAMPCCRN